MKNMNIQIEANKNFSSERNFEVVERKGIGHPDTVADGIAETVSVEYSKYCLQKYGLVLHHNVDKVSVLGGLARIEWGSTEIIEPIRIIFNGRMSKSFADEKIPIEDICISAARKFLIKALPSLDLDKDISFIHQHTTYSKNPKWFSPDSIDDLPEYKKIFANDTSAVASSSPLTVVEKLVLEIEGFFYDDKQMPVYRECGQDIKVMAVRNKECIDIRVCFPVILKYCSNVNDYWSITNYIYDRLLSFIRTLLPNRYRFNLELNLKRDQDIKEAKYLYALVGGSALDYGEEGVVGRGNNRSGIIPMFRPFSMEAACGKNPVYHVGKVLGVVLDDVTKSIKEKTGQSTEALLVAKNGDDLFDPSQIIIRTDQRGDTSTIKNIIKEAFSKRNWTERIITEELLIPKTGNLIC
jgi:S-adenosylmethionine synthetase